MGEKEELSRVPRVTKHPHCSERTSLALISHCIQALCQLLAVLAGAVTSTGIASTPDLQIKLAQAPQGTRLQRLSRFPLPKAQLGLTATTPLTTRV